MDLSALLPVLMAAAPPKVLDQVGDWMRSLVDSSLTYDEAAPALLLQAVRSASSVSTRRCTEQAKAFASQARFGEMPS